MEFRTLKQQILLITSTFGVICALVVGSFAWYRMSNGGNLNVNIDTTEGSAISFTFSSYKDVDGTLSPAKMNQGVLNNWLNKDKYQGGKIDILNIPTSNGCLPKKEDVYQDGGRGNILFDRYVLDENKHMVPVNSEDEYLYQPATVLYRQFTLRLGSTTSDVEKNAVFSIDVDYYDVFQHEAGETSKHKLMQQDALSFTFYVFDADVNASTLSEISTVVNKNATNKKTISEEFYDPNESGRYVKTEDKTVNSEKTYYTASATSTPASSSISYNTPTYYCASSDDSDPDLIELCKNTDVSGKTFYNMSEVSSPSDSGLTTYYEKVVNRAYRFTRNGAEYSYDLKKDDDDTALCETWNKQNESEYEVNPYTVTDPNQKEGENGKFFRQVTLRGLEFNKTYYVLTCVYYNVPDELLDGDLWLAKRMDINIGYKIVTSDSSSTTDTGSNA